LSRAASRKARAAPPGIRALLSYRINALANQLSRGAALRYKREFGVSLWEWRTIALLGEPALDETKALSQTDLARLAGLDKGQVSRVVSGLAERGLVLRVADASDARGVRLSLTRTGRRLYEGLITAAAERNDALLGTLSAAEHALLESALARLNATARGLIDAERRAASAGKSAKSPT
jgi:DNA-binding MarR family transcriptional regulator